MQVQKNLVLVILSLSCLSLVDAARKRSGLSGEKTAAGSPEELLEHGRNLVRSSKPSSATAAIKLFKSAVHSFEMAKAAFEAEGTSSQNQMFSGPTIYHSDPRGSHILLELGQVYRKLANAQKALAIETDDSKITWRSTAVLGAQTWRNLSEVSGGDAVNPFAAKEEARCYHLVEDYEAANSAWMRFQTHNSDPTTALDRKDMLQCMLYSLKLEERELALQVYQQMLLSGELPGADPSPILLEVHSRAILVALETAKHFHSTGQIDKRLSKEQWVAGLWSKMRPTFPWRHITQTPALFDATLADAVPTPWLEVHKTDVCSKLQYHSSEIIAEYNAFVSGGNALTLFTGQHSKQRLIGASNSSKWEYLFIRKPSPKRSSPQFDAEVCTFFPFTCSLLAKTALVAGKYQRTQCLRGQCTASAQPQHAGEIGFFKLAAGVNVPNDVGPTNQRLKCQLGIDIPSETIMNVGGEKRRLNQSQVVAFDDSYHHSIDTTQASGTTVLLDVPFWSPKLANEVLLEDKDEL